MTPPSPRTTPRPVLAGLALAAAIAGLAGCLGSPATDATHADGAAKADVPTWRVGDRWSYAILVDNASAGTVVYEVTGTATVLNGTAYRVEETTTRQGETPVTRVLHFDAATLNRVWDDCDEEPRGAPDCQGRIRILDFPLIEGKSWTTRVAEGDAVVLHEANVTRVPDAALPPEAGGTGEAWLVRVRPAEPGDWGVRWDAWYAPEVGFYGERVAYALDGSVAERWVLDESSRAAAGAGA